MTTLTLYRASENARRKPTYSTFRWAQMDLRMLTIASFALAAFGSIDIIFEPYGRFVFFILSAPALLVALAFLFKIFRNGHYLLFSFSMYLVYEAWLPWAVNFLFLIPFSLWRANAIDSQVALKIIKIMVIYCTIYMGIVGVSIRYIEKFRPKEIFRPTLVFGSKNLNLFVMLLSVGIAVFAIIAGGLESREVWLMDSDTSDRLLLRTAILLIIFGFSIALFSGRKLTHFLTLSCLVLAGSAVLLGLNGYRNVLVSLLLMAVVYHGMRRPITAGQFVSFSMGGSLAFLLLIFLSLTRALHLSFYEIFATSGLAVRLWEVTGEVVGAAQQMNIIAANIILNDPHHFWGYTFLESVANVLPNAIRNSLFATELTQERILDVMTPVLPSYFVVSGHNMGATVYLEGMLNFGYAGPPIVGAFYVVIFALMEARRFYSPVWFIMYLTMIGNSYMPAWYGSSNFLKITLTNLLISVIFVAIIKGVRGKVYLSH